MKRRELETASGTIHFPAFLPVTTYGGRFPLDDVVRPYLDRLAPAIMVSYHYARKMTIRPRVPLFIDSGGFASLFKDAKMVDGGDCVSIHTKEGDVIDPAEVLALQMEKADIGATVDFIVPPGMEGDEAEHRQDATVHNALWAVKQLRREEFRLYASVQAWDPSSAKRIMEKLAPHAFDGFALGGMVPRARNPERVVEIVRAVREVEEKRPLHVFGIGKPSLVRQLFTEGVDSVDSSSYLKYAANKKWLDPQSRAYLPISKELDCPCRACSSLGLDYMSLSGELNTLSLALHNIIVLNKITQSPKK